MDPFSWGKTEFHEQSGTDRDPAQDQNDEYHMPVAGISLPKIKAAMAALVSDNQLLFIERALPAVRAQA